MEYIIASHSHVSQLSEVGGNRQKANRSEPIREEGRTPPYIYQAQPKEKIIHFMFVRASPPSLY
jgi:hypothetical protein